MNDQERWVLLTPRRLQVAELLLEGMSNKEITDRLDVSESTVKQHVVDLRNIFGAINRTQLAVMLAELRMGDGESANRKPDG
jgi:DNA-binding NarL/FixJ family response regulator